MCETNSGAVYIYGPWGSSIAAALVEKISGKPFEVAMEERIFCPLGMADATFFPTRDQMNRMDASAFGLRYFTYPLTDESRKATADFGLFATVEDVKKFAAALRAGGVAANGKRILSEKSAAAFFRKQTPDAVDRSYSFGFNVDDRTGLIWCSSATGMRLSISGKCSKVEKF